MNTKSTHRWLATFAGIFVGSVIGWNMNYSVLSLVIGMAAGAIVGYFSLNPGEVKRGIRMAINRMQAEEFHEEIKGQMRINLKKELLIFATFMGLWSLLSFCIFVSPLMRPEARLAAGGDFIMVISFCFVFSLLCAMAAVLWVVLFLLSLRILLATPEIARKFVYPLIRRLIIFVHSAERTQCAVYSVLGTATMWYLHPHSLIAVVIGASVGATVSELVWHLVSKRLIEMQAV